MTVEGSQRLVTIALPKLKRSCCIRASPPGSRHCTEKERRLKWLEWSDLPNEHAVCSAWLTRKRNALRQNTIGTEHLLLGLIQEEGGVAGRVLRDLGLEPDRVREMVERLSGFGQYRGGKIDLSPGVQQVLEFAIDEARQLGHHYIGTEHLLLGLVRLTEGPAMDVLRKLGVTPEQIRRQTRRVLQESSTATAAAATGQPANASRHHAVKKKIPRRRWSTSWRSI